MLRPENHHQRVLAQIVQVERHQEPPRPQFRWPPALDANRDVTYARLLFPAPSPVDGVPAVRTALLWQEMVSLQFHDLEFEICAAP